MKNKTRVGVTYLLLAMGLAAAGCGDERVVPTTVSAPSPVASPAPMNGLLGFTDRGTGFTTTDLRDVHEQILRFSTAGELIWVADGARLPGFLVRGLAIEGKICPEGCTLVVRFGTRDGERRAYLTADYGHDNPGTLVDVEITGGTLVVARTGVFPPGSPTLSGVVTEMTPAGPVAVPGAYVYRGEETGWRNATTDGTGFFEIRGLYDGPEVLVVGKDGYVEVSPQVSIRGDTRFDVQLRRR